MQDEGGGIQLLFRLDTSDHSPRKRIKVHSVISLDVLAKAMTDQDLAFVLSREKEAMERQGIHPILERTLNLEGVSLSCIGDTTTLNSKGIFDIEPISWTCISPGGPKVGMQASEPDFDEVWDIGSHIRKKS